jgi:hypothetical protein
MKVTIKERFQICEILPRTFSLEEYAVKGSIQKKMCFTESEISSLGITQTALGFVWDKKHNEDTFEIELTANEFDFLTASAGSLDKAKGITDATVDICKRLLTK